MRGNGNYYPSYLPTPPMAKVAEHIKESHAIEPVEKKEEISMSKAIEKGVIWGFIYHLITGK